MEKINELKKELKEYKHEKYRRIFFNDLIDTLTNWFYILCVIIWLSSTGIQIYFGRAVWFAAITSAPIIIVPLIVAIAQCLEYRSFNKFQKSYIKLKISQEEEKYFGSNK
jgi:hypothetical protein